MRLLPLVLVAGCAAAPAPVKAPATPSLPSTAIEDRFYVQPTLAGGQKLLLLTDSGGGLFIYKDRVTALGLPVEKTTEADEEGQALEITRLVFAPGAGIPMPKALGGGLMVFDAPHLFHDSSDGLLGQDWFADHVWTFDYPGKRLLLLDALPVHDPAHEVKLGFPVDGAGARKTNFPRIQAEIDGETIDFLFDTGATVRLKPEALAKMGDGRPAERATSFIVQSRFQAWRKRHPDWRVIEEADANVGSAPMILVPVVKVAGFEAHDVWFTARENPNFHQFMSQWMDKKIDGALGGSAYRAFRVSVDYPRAIAVFEKL